MVSAMPRKPSSFSSNSHAGSSNGSLRRMGIIGCIGREIGRRGRSSQAKAGWMFATAAAPESTDSNSLMGCGTTSSEASSRRVVLCTWGWGHGVGVGESVRKQGNRVHSRRGDHRKPKGKGRDASTGFVVEALSEIHARCRQAAQPAIRFSASSLN